MQTCYEIVFGRKINWLENGIKPLNENTTFSVFGIAIIKSKFEGYCS
jgi:hypothetical protein